MKIMDDELLELYKPFVRFLAETAGPSCEVVLHDIRNPENSVIAIENGYHSGRKVGYPLTDFAKKVISNGSYKSKDFITNYSGKAKGNEFLSSTFFIKNNGELIGMLCVNKDLRVSHEFTNVFQLLKQQYNLADAENQIHETLDIPASKKLQETIAQAIEATGKKPMNMTKEEKIEVVAKLKEKGAFEVKGAIREIARQLEVSSPTVYRYLQNIHRE